MVAVDDVDEEPAARIPQTIRLLEPRLVSVLLIAAVSPFSANAIAASLPGMANSLGVSDARIGLVMTAVTLPPMLLTPAVGAFGDTYGRRVIVIPALFLFGAAGVLIPLADQFWLILVLRAVQGIGIAGSAPVAVTLLGDLYSGTAATTAQGLRSSSTALAASLSAFVGGWLAGFGWSLPFVLYAFSFVVMGLVYLYIPEPTRETDADSSPADIVRDSAGKLRNTLGDVKLLVLMGGGFVRFFVLFAILTFVPLFATRTLGATPFVVGLLLGLLGVRVVVSPVVGLVIARLSRRRALLASVTLILVTVALVPYAPDIRWLGVLVALNAVGDAIFSPLVNDTVTAHSSDGVRNRVVSVMRSFKETGKTAAPVVLGLVFTFGRFSWVFITTAAVVALYVLALVWVSNDDEIGTAVTDVDRTS